MVYLYGGGRWMHTANWPDTNLLWDRNHTAVLVRFVPELIRPTGRQRVLIQEYCNTPAVKQLLDHSMCSSEHGQRGHSTSHHGGAGEKLEVVSGHIRAVAARGMKELSEILVRRSDLELEQEEKRSARMTGGVGSLSYYGKPRNSVFCLEKQKQMEGTWAIFRHRPRAVSLSEEAVAGLQQEQWLQPRTRPPQGPLQERWGASGWRKKQDSPTVSGGRDFDGERGKFTDPFPLCPNFSSPGEPKGLFPVFDQFPPVSDLSLALLLVSVKGKAVSVLLCIHSSGIHLETWPVLSTRKTGDPWHQKGKIHIRLKAYK